MPEITLTTHSDADAAILATLANILARQDSFSKQLRAFSDTVENDQHPLGLSFQPRPGQLLICHFGLGYQEPEMTKTRPVLVVSPRRRDASRLCTIVPISSKPPEELQAYHYRLPDGLIPSKKYKESWIKGDLVTSVGCHRLDRIKVGFRKYEAPTVPDEVLREARRCVLHAAGMHALTAHW